jgi:hypothetical protein
MESSSQRHERQTPAAGYGERTGTSEMTRLKGSIRTAFLIAGALLLVPLAARAEGAKTVVIFEGRQISVPVPNSWTLEEGRDPHHGTPTLRIAAPKEEIVMQISFFPDSEGRLASRKDLEAEAQRIFAFYLESAVEKEMRLTFFDASDGMGVYTSFTDSKLDPKQIPEGEKLVSTTGIRSWKGAYLLFTLLTDSTKSPTYEKALDLVRTGLKQVKAPVSF